MDLEAGGAGVVVEEDKAAGIVSQRPVGGEEGLPSLLLAVKEGGVAEVFSLVGHRGSGAGLVCGEEAVDVAVAARSGVSDDA